MLSRVTKIALWALGGPLMLLVVCIGVLLWRLSAGPLAINVLTPYLEQALKEPLAGRRITIQDTLLVWDRASHSLDLHARDVIMRDHDGTVLATLPIVDVALSLQALLHRTIAPTAVKLEGVQLSLMRSSDGALLFGVGDTATSPLENRRLEHVALGRVWQGVADTFDRLTTAPAPGQPLSYLQQVGVRQSALRIHDQTSGLLWQVPQVDITFTRIGGRLTGQLQVTVALPDSRPTLNATLVYERATQLMDIEIGFAHLHPASVARLIPALKHMQGFELPLSGTLALSLHSGGPLQEISIAISGGAGRLWHPHVRIKPRSITGLSIRGVVNATNRTARLDEAVITMPQPGAQSARLIVSGTAKGLGADLTVAGNVSLKTFPLAALKDYWPADVLRDTRAWLVESLVAGTVDQADVHLDMVLPGRHMAKTTLKRLEGAIRFHGSEVHYLRPLPPLTDVTGTARFDQQGFHIVVERGAGAGLQLTSGTVDISGIDVGRDAIAIQVALAAPMPALLTLLDHPRLALLSGIDIDPAMSHGQATVDLALAFPLRGTIHFKDITIQARGTLQDAAMQKILLGQDVHHGMLELNLDQQRMTMTGSVSFAGVPLTFTWTEAFTKTTKWRSVIDADIPHMSHNDLAKLGVEVQDLVTGSIHATMKVNIGHDGTQVVQVATNLQETELRLPWLGWSKPPGQPGALHGTVELDARHVRGHSTFVLDAETLATRGTVRFHLSEKRLDSVELHDLVLGESRLSSVIIRHQDGGFDVTIGAGVLDALPLLSAFQGANDTSRRSTTSTPYIRLDAPALQRVSFGPERVVQHVAVRCAYNRGQWEFLEVSGQIPPFTTLETNRSTLPTTFSVAYRPAPSGHYTLAVFADDLGATLRTLSLDDRLTGGRLKLEGQTQAPQPESRLDTTVDLKNFTVKRAPLLGRILAAASFTGLVDLLNGSGLTFTRLSGDVSLEQGLLTVTRLNAYGGSLGLTAEGTIHLTTGTIHLKGTVIPVQGINTLPGKIPLIGKFLVGGKGQGLIAITYRINGTLHAPQVSVNPASALTPGFVRGIFGLFEGSTNQEIE